MAARHRQAKKRQRQAVPPTVRCSDCPGAVVLVSGLVIYPHRPDLDHKQFWRCESCGAYVGCHPGTEHPLGSPAGPATRAARNAAHAAFDPLWKAKMARENVRKHVARGAAYRWLADALGIDPSACHIGMMDEATALRVVDLCLPYLNRSAA